MTSRNDAAPGVQTGGEPSETLAASADLDPYSTPAGYQMAVDRLLMLAAAQGFVIGVRCSVCGGVLTARRSRARGVGPRCARRVMTA